MTTGSEINIITGELVPDERRADFVDALFGIHFSTQLEPYVFAVASELSSQYGGGYWSLHSLSNGGFYMAPESESLFRVQCPNGFEDVMSADALGVTTCLYAYSRLSFRAGDRIAEVYARHYHLLREFMMGHAEVDAILQATD